MESAKLKNKMPALFLRHGSPMNAITENHFTDFLKKLAADIPTPKSILVVSAHWLTKETQVLQLEHPTTIYDFYGFPPPLYQIKYPAPGAIELADRVVELVSQNQFAKQVGANQISVTKNWGYDHGAWALLALMYPEHKIPVTQLSLRKDLNFLQHYYIAESLKPLRDEGVLVLCSGNLVHNLRQIDFNENAKPMDWAVQFDEWIKEQLIQKNHEALINPHMLQPQLWKQAHPSWDHYLPFIYTLGLSEANEDAKMIFEGIQNGSVSMRSVRFG